MNSRIILADQDESVRKMITRVLMGAGYSVIPAATAGEAMQIFEAEHPDLILLDVELPDQPWPQTVTRLRLQDPVIPIILLTDWPKPYEQAVQRGVDALIEKPIDLPLLLNRIRECLSATPRSPENPATSNAAAHAVSKG